MSGLNMATMRGEPGVPPTYGGPFIDGRIVADDPDVLYAKGEFNHVDLMVGATSSDIGFGVAKSKDELFLPFGPLRGRLQGSYDPDGSAPVTDLARQVAMDGLMIEPARHVAKLFAAQGQKAFLYRFSYVADAMKKEWVTGAPHATDIPFFFNTVAAKYGSTLTERDAGASAAMFRALLAFSRDGRPGEGWPAWSAAKDGLMDFRADGSAGWGPDARQAKLDATEAAAEASRR